jgi:hypothetical protein
MNNYQEPLFSTLRMKKYGVNLWEAQPEGQAEVFYGFDGAASWSPTLTMKRAEEIKRQP